MKPIYALRDEAVITRDLKKLGPLLRDRMAAARMAIGFLQEAAGEIPKLPEGVPRFSINEMAAVVLPDTTQKDTGNLKTRVWRPSISVIHLAAVMSVTLNNLAFQYHQQYL